MQRRPTVVLADVGDPMRIMRDCKAAWIGGGMPRELWDQFFEESTRDRSAATLIDSVHRWFSVEETR